jgi:hypothetical protein
VNPENVDTSGKMTAQDALQNLHALLYRHVVCLAIQYVALDGNGKPVGMEHFLAISGFIMLFRDRCFLVTAGHALEDLDKPLKQRRIQITSCCIADYFGSGAKVHQPMPFHYDDQTVKGYINNSDIGLDVGLIYLRDFYRSSLEANGIVPIVEADWRNADSIPFEVFVVLGFPKEWVDQATKSVEQGKSITATVPMAVISVDLIQDDSLIPSSVSLPQSQLPWFVGKIIQTSIPSIVGMSGGPIMGFARTPEGVKYWPVALQSAWYEQSRIILACPLPVVSLHCCRVQDSQGFPTRATAHSL